MLWSKDIVAERCGTSGSVRDAVRHCDARWARMLLLRVPMGVERGCGVHLRVIYIIVRGRMLVEYRAEFIDVQRSCKCKVALGGSVGRRVVLPCQGRADRLALIQKRCAAWLRT